MISSDHTAYCKEFCFRCHCTCRIPQFLKRSCDLIIKRVHRLQILVLGKKIDGLKNWALHSIPTIHQVASQIDSELHSQIALIHSQLHSFLMVTLQLTKINVNGAVSRYGLSCWLYKNKHVQLDRCCAYSVSITTYIAHS